MDIIESVAIISTIYLCCLIFHVILPCYITEGYCCDKDGRVLIYRINGFLVLTVYIIIFCWCPSVKLYSLYQSNALIGNLFGLIGSFAFYVRGGDEKYSRCTTIDQVKGGTLPPLANNEVNPIKKFFLGCEWNPRFFNVDVKMFLYMVGAIQLELNLLSCCIYQIESWDGKISYAMALYTVLFSFFVAEYMFFENVHLYTYDLFAEKIGFKLLWGCLAFYPFFYPLNGYFLASLPKGTDINPLSAGCIGILYLIGWIATRGANMQKYYFRKFPGKKTFLFGLIRQDVIKNSRILCSGWWGVSRHLNYLGEILQALALALPLCLLAATWQLKFVALLYPLYYIVLFIPRQFDDDALCRAKYGSMWLEYERTVPWRIIPFVY